MFEIVKLRSVGSQFVKIFTINIYLIVSHHIEKIINVRSDTAVKPNIESLHVFIYLSSVA